MTWQAILAIFFVILLLLLMSRLPVAFSFLVTNLVTVGIVYGLEAGINQLVLSTYDSVVRFTLTPIPAFILLGELLFRSGLAVKALDVLSQFLGRLPGRLSLLAVGSGTLFAALSGSNLANTSMLGSLLVPDMRRRGYDIRMAAGPIMAAGTLAMLIPPSAVAVLLGGIGRISIGDLLIAGLMPGLVLAALFAIYIVVICAIKPELAPKYEHDAPPWRDRLIGLVRHVLPLLSVIFVVVGFIFLGIATPTESASLAALVALVLVAVNKRLTWKVIAETAKGTIRTTGMIMLIFAFAAGFSQLLAFTGATRSLIGIITGFGAEAGTVILLMMIIVLVLGMFLEQTSIMMITLPLFMPLVAEFDINPVWFGIMMLIALDLGNLTPPFGFNLFVMKGVVSKDVSMADIYRSVLPYILISLLLLIIVYFWPALALWLPGVGSA